MAKYRFDQVARECRTTFKGDKNGMPIVGLEHLVPNEMLVRDFEVDTENTFTKSFKQGQILFGRRRAYQQKAGVALFDGICSGDITVIEAIPGKIEPNLLPFIVQNEQFFEHAVQGSAGSLSPRVKWEHLASYEIELPTMEKQRVLADKLWTAYRLKESYKKLLAATDEMGKSQFIEMVGDLQKNGTLSDYCEMKAGKSIKSDSINSQYNDGLYPCYGGNGLRGYVETYSHDGVYDIIGRQGALCGNITLTKGKFYATEHAIVVRPKTPINEYWLYFALAQMNLNQYARGVAQPGLAVKQLEKLPFGIPSKGKQEKFAAVYQQSDKSKLLHRKSIKYSKYSL
mgnify:CR=1 FL=1